jgi:endonuclease/exonuclease/phosphatase family metal-dependent hydrolase
MAADQRDAGIADRESGIEMDRFRIATYNIHKGRGLDGRVSIERIARVLGEIDADLIALQEVVSHEGLSIQDHQASYLADRFGYSLERLRSIAAECTAM